MVEGSDFFFGLKIDVSDSAACDGQPWTFQLLAASWIASLFAYVFVANEHLYPLYHLNPVMK